MGEPQMRQFFSQFGKITRLRLSRSKKNAQPKGFAFIEFEELSVAKIVAETMDKYYLFGKTLDCHLVPKEKQHGGLFKNHKKEMVNMTNARLRKAKEEYNDRPDVVVDGETLPQTTTTQMKRRGKANRKLNKMLAKLGIDFKPEDAQEGGPIKNHRIKEKEERKRKTSAAEAEPAKKRKKNA